MKFDTQLAHLGRSSAQTSQSVNPPLVRASTTLFPTLAEFKQSYRGLVFEAPRYGRSGTSTNFELQTAMAQLCQAETCLATASGLSAIAAVLSAHAGPGKHILVQDSVYGPTRVLCEQSLAASGTQIEFFSASEIQDEHSQFAKRILPHTSLIFIEIPASLTMQMLDVRALANIAKQANVPLAADSTWGTPLYFDAHRLGIDISIHAATKCINGHSDVMLGLITGSYASLQSTRKWCDQFGSHAAPDACWLALRGLRTLAVRMQRHQSSALHVAQFLQQQPQIKNVLFPVLPNDPGHALWQAQFTGGAGPFSFALQACSEAKFEQFINALQLFGLGTSWGGYESLVMPAIPHHLRALAVQADEGRLVRVHIGLEDADDLCADLRQALAML